MNKYVVMINADDTVIINSDNAPDCAIRDEQRAYAPKACPERNH